MQDEVNRLHQELADVKGLLLQLLSPSQQQHQTAAQRAVPTSQTAALPADASCNQQLSPGLKASVQLDLSHEEQHHSSDATVAHQQQAQLVPLRIIGQSLKPSIQEAVMLQRAAHAAQQHSSDHGSDGHAAHVGQSSQSSSQQDSDAQQQENKGTSCARNADSCSTPPAYDAAVHVTTATVSSKEQLEQQATGKLASSWTTAPGCCREVDMLAKRVHANMEAASGQEELQAQPEQQPGRSSRVLTLVLTPVRVLLWDIILPGDYFALAWDLIMLLVILYLCIALPYTVAFAIDFSDLSHPMAQIDLVFSALFMLDCILNFRTAFVGDDGKVVMQRDRIAMHYIKGWFLFDVISSLPYEQMVHQGDHGIPTTSIIALLKIPRILRLVKVLRLLKLLRMARLTKLPALMSRVEWLLNRPMMQLATMFALCCMLLHWIACAWYYVAMFGSDGGWVRANGLEDTTEGHKYVAALYFAVSTVATVGFGDIVAVTLREKVVALITMLIGASVFGYFMGSMSVMVSAANSTRARMTAKRRAVDDFLTHRRVPRALADKVKSYYDYVIEREVQADEADIIKGLSASLRTQIVLHLYSEALEKVPFFRGQHPQFITSVVTALQLEFYAPGDVVVRQGDMGDAMYFLAQGSLEVRLYQDEEGNTLAHSQYERSRSKGASCPSTPSTEQTLLRQQQGAEDNKPSWKDRLLRRKRSESQHNGNAADGQGADCTQLPWRGGSSGWTYEDELTHKPYRHLGYLHPGEYFGEYSCLLGQERSATVVASGYVELYSLSRADLEMVLQQWPELAEQFEAMVEEAAGSLFPPDQHASSPLARWNVVKAACAQQVNGSTADPQHGTPNLHLQRHQEADASGAARQAFSPEQGQGQRLSVAVPPAAASAQGSMSGGPTFTRDSSRSGSGNRGGFLGRTSFLGGLFGDRGGSGSGGMPSSPRHRPTLAGQLQQSLLQHARSSPIAINTAGAAAGGDSWSLDMQKPQHQQQHFNRFAELGRMSFVAAAPSLPDPAVFDFPSLAAQSVSTMSIGNMSGVSGPSLSGPSAAAAALQGQGQLPPAAGGRVHRRSGSLTRASLPSGQERRSSTNGGSITLNRSSLPGQGRGTGLFRTNSAQRYLLPGLRSGVLLTQVENEDDSQAPTRTLQAQQSLSRCSKRLSS